MLNNHKQLQIISIFSPNENNYFWYTIQKEYINKNTTINFNYQVYLNGCDDSFFDSNEIYHKQPFDQSSRSQSDNHYQCLKNIKIDTSYQFFLLLDSDCFPILRDWNNILVNKLTQYKLNQASIIRPENLDIIAHPSMMFFLRSGFANFRPSLVKFFNLLGIQHTDITCNAKFFPLIRTNYLNLHPICAGIYYDMFYHHGAGSRFPIYRSTDIDKYYHYPDHVTWASAAMSALKSDSNKFINSLIRVSNG